MQRIALIVEAGFLTHHWGVRVYVYSLAKVLERHGWIVDFVYPAEAPSGELRWYKLHLRDSSLFSAAAPSAAGRPSEVWAALRDTAFNSASKTPETPDTAGRRDPPVMPIGSTLEFEHYDVAIVTNPWMVKWRERLPARRTMGLVFDLIPNLFGLLLDDGKPFGFARQHEMGFKYFEECCDQVLAISEHTRDTYLEFVRSRRPGGVGPDVVALPPIAPYGSLEAQRTTCRDRRAQRLVLAGCFDLRKGLRELPELINGIADDVEEVVVYGGVRCRKEHAETFFNSLRVDRIVWHLGATASQVRDIFSQSSILLFPSKFEGLGLPLIEAQLEGCRVATYPLSPMKELALSGAVALSETPAESIERLRRALAEPFGHASLQREARARFVARNLEISPLQSDRSRDSMPALLGAA